MGLLNKKNGVLLAGILVVGTLFQGGTVDALSYSENIVPVLTSYTGSNGAASASVEETDHESWRAFDETVTQNSYWRAPSNQTSRISYQFNNKTVINKYTVQADAYSGEDAPREWQFAGKVGSSWLLIDEQSNQTSWSPGEKRTFVVNNDVAYTAYALFIKSSNGSEWVAVDQLELSQFHNNSNLVPAASPTLSDAAVGASASVNPELAWKAFDHINDLDSAWISNSERYEDASLSYTFDQPQVVKGYSLLVQNKSKAPVSWMLVGTNDGQQWDEVIHEVKSSVRWEAGIPKVYEVDNDTPYKTYKLVISRNSGPVQVSINEFELY